MPRNITRLFIESAGSGPREGLIDSVMQAVGSERRRAMLLRRIPIMASGLALSGAAAVYTVFQTFSEAAHSGLVGYLSVFVTDTGAMMASWQDYLLTLLDALPIAPLAGACAALFVFFALLRSLDRVITPPSRLHTI